MKKLKNLFDLSGRTIIVAGGAGQIGFAFCEILADMGANVVIADIDSEMALNKIKHMEDGINAKMSVYALDVSKANQVKDVIQKINNNHQRLYGLVNCFHFKGNTRKLDKMSNFFTGFEDYPEEAWNMVHDVNLKGSFLMSQAVIPYFVDNGGGVIVNISSTYGIVSANKSIYGSSGINSPVAYATSKAAIINLTRYMATHLADKNIRVNCLSPGGVFNNQDEDFLKNYNALTPMQRMAHAEDYQGSIAFLMSDASSYMTGANLIVDGGWTTW